MLNFLGNLLCAVGIHKWEKDPSKKEFIKETGIHFAWFSEGIQKATRKCLRKNCSCSQKVKRKGIIGPGNGKAEKWTRVSKSDEAYIDSSPTL